MKFGYRDRILLLIGCVIIILGIGFFVFIQPKYKDMTANKKKCEEAEKAWTQKKNEFDEIPDIQQRIKNRYKKAYDVSTNFTDEMDATKLDQFLQTQFFNTEENIKNKTKLESALNVTDETTRGMSYYFYTPSIVTYPLYEAADLDHSLAAAVEEKTKESTILSERAAQVVGAGNAGFTVRINKKDAFEFIDGVKKYADDHKDAMLITSITMAEYDFNGGVAMERDEEGKITGERPENLKEKYDEVEDEDLGYTSVTINYEVYYMQEPTEPDVGPEYHPEIWDGDEWRTWTDEAQTQE